MSMKGFKLAFSLLLSICAVWARRSALAIGEDKRTREQESIGYQLHMLDMKEQKNRHRIKDFSKIEKKAEKICETILYNLNTL